MYLIYIYIYLRKHQDTCNERGRTTDKHKQYTRNVR